MIFFLIWLVCAFGAMAIASSKGLGGCLWFVLGLVLGPIGMLIAMGMHPNYEALDARRAGAAILDEPQRARPRPRPYRRPNRRGVIT